MGFFLIISDTSEERKHSHKKSCFLEIPSLAVSTAGVWFGLPLQADRADHDGNRASIIL